MLSTLIALFAAHVLADFVLQTRHMAQNKARPGLLALHGLIVLIATIAMSGSIDALPIAIVVLVHTATDFVKAKSGRDHFTAFCLDQTVHIATIVLVALLFPELFARGWWAWGPVESGLVLKAMAGGSGFVVAVRAGSFLIGKFMSRFQQGAPVQGLPQGGYYIGLFERAIIFAVVLAGHMEMVGFLVAAKSILRFEASKDRAASEYVIIGTLLSVAWAMACAYLTLWVLGELSA